MVCFIFKRILSLWNLEFALLYLETTELPYIVFFYQSSILYVEEKPQQINNNNFTTGVRQKCITVSLLLIDTPVSLIPREALNYFYEHGPIFESL